MKLPESFESRARHLSRSIDESVELLCGADLNPKAVNWLWDGWLARGKFHILGGAPGTGKTTLACSLVSTITRGGPWPDGSRCTQASNVLFWSGEDDPQDTLTPRMALSGADLTRVFFVDSVTAPYGKRPFDPSSDIELLAEKIAAIGDCAALVVDPLVSAISGDSHKNAETRRGLQPLVDLGSRTGCAILGITHLNKGSSNREPLERLTGSLAFGALARVAMVTARDQGDEEGQRRLFLRVKSNIGPDGGGFEYTLRQEALPSNSAISSSYAKWGIAVEGNPREVLAKAEAFEEDDGPGMSAKQFLLDALEAGPILSTNLKSEGKELGFSWATIRRAQKALGVIARKQGMTGGWVWELPQTESKTLKNSEDAHKENLSAFNKSEHLRIEAVIL